MWYPVFLIWKQTALVSEMGHTYSKPQMWLRTDLKNQDSLRVSSCVCWDLPGNSLPRNLDGFYRTSSSLWFFLCFKGQLYNHDFVPPLVSPELCPCLCFKPPALASSSLLPLSLALFWIFLSGVWAHPSHAYLCGPSCHSFPGTHCPLPPSAGVAFCSLSKASCSLPIFQNFLPLDHLMYILSINLHFLQILKDKVFIFLWVL